MDIRATNFVAKIPQDPFAGLGSPPEMQTASEAPCVFEYAITNVFLIYSPPPKPMLHCCRWDSGIAARCKDRADKSFRIVTMENFSMPEIFLKKYSILGPFLRKKYG
jgi:hypothetical protein